MTTLTNVKLGKLVPKHDKRTLHLANYLNTKALPPIPASVDWSGKVPNWGMMGNDRLGNCTCASAGHLIEAWTANASTEIVPSDNDIIAAYSAVSGYDPNTGNNDNGAVEVDVLNYWRRTGIANHKIDAYVALEPQNHRHIQTSVYLFGGVYIGVALPLSAQGQSVWSVPAYGTTGDGAPGSWGGHAVPICSFSAYGVTVITWGQLMQVTWPFLDCYMDEAYAVLSRDFINAQNIAPNSIDWSSLQQDLNAITQ